MRLSLGGSFVAWGCLAVTASSAPGQRLELIQEIGSAVGSPDYTFFRIGELQTDERGNTYVLDQGDKVLRVYDTAGRLKTRIGREGSGPGEFMLPTQLELGRDEIRVVDARQLRLIRFDYTGAHLGTGGLNLPLGMQASSINELRGGSALVQTIYRASVGGERHDPYSHVVILNADRTVQDTLASYEPPVVIWYTPGQKAPWGLVPLDLGEGGAVAVLADSLIALVDGTSGHVTLTRVTDGVAVAFATLDLGVRGQEFPKHLLDSIRDSIRQAKRDTRLLVTGPTSRSAVSGQAFFAADGQLWVELAAASAGDREWVRINPATGARTTIRVPRRLALRAVRGSRLYGIWRDTLDVQTVRVYRVAGTWQGGMQARSERQLAGWVHAAQPAAAGRRSQGKGVARKRRRTPLRPGDAGLLRCRKPRNVIDMTHS